MSIALILCNLCYILMLKGVPNWLHIVLSILSVIFNCVALALEDGIISRVRILEDKINKKGGE